VKILLVQITNKNFGDSVIADNTRYLLQKITSHRFLRKYEILDYAINTEDLGQVRYVDAIVFAGGGLVKFRQEKLYRQVSELIMEAQKYGVPVFLNAVGVEGFDESDERCRMLVEALNQPCVKGITVRDDIVCLREHYIRNSYTAVEEVFDPAIWSPKTYGPSDRKPSGKKRIGLGVARDTLFVDYGIEEIDRDYLLALWRDIAACLEKRGYEWQIFTNGLGQDEDFACDVLAAIGHGQKLPQPWDARELVGQIAAMDGMIACRMHSNIIAYAYGIPSIGLVWNRKMTFWGEKCGYPERFIPSDRLTAETIVDAMEKAFADGTRRPSRRMRMGTYRLLARFVDRACREREVETPQIDVAGHLVAPALGGSDFKYRNLNTIPQMKRSVARGYRHLELDVRMASDGQLVCVNGWNKATATALGNAKAEQELGSEEFLEASYYGHFPTCSFEQAVKAFCGLETEHRVTLILDVGRPKTETLDAFYEKLTDILKRQGADPQNIMVRVQRERDVKAIRQFGFLCPLIYFLAEEGAIEKVVEFCHRKKIRMVSMTEKTWDPALQEMLQQEGLRTLILTYTKAGDVIGAITAGADLAASHYYDVNYISRLIDRRNRNTKGETK
jgi:polysaccharide pyruvyl transferase WcaK-like protein/glycerophosphoryl diester phosphodiesterase